MDRMAYLIEYFQNGVIGAEVSLLALEATQQTARMGMVERHAERVRVIDVDQGSEIWSETALAS